MKKKDIIREYNKMLKAEKLQPADVNLGAGGAALMYGLREETDDLDVDIPNPLFDKYLKSGKYELSYFGEVEILAYNEHIDMHRRLRDFETRMVDGVCCYSPMELLKQKQKLNRPKDQKDIAALSAMIKKEQMKTLSRW